MNSYTALEPTIKLLTLEGTPKERGRIHGESLKPMILHAMKIWKVNLRRLTGVDVDEYIDKFVAETGLLSAAEKWAPNILAEVDGIAEGTGVDFNTVFAWQSMDEEWWYRIFEKKLGTSAFVGHCSLLGQSGQPTLLAQNMDLANFYDGLQVLLHIKDAESSVQTYVFTVAGMVGLYGMNSTPLGVGVNTLLSLNHSTQGLPVAFVVRKILEQTSLNDAVRFIHEIKHASGQNYLIGDQEKVVDFECSGNRVCEFAPYGGASVLYHTNHPIVNNDGISSAEVAKELALAGRSRERYDFLESKLKNSSETVTEKLARDILCSHDAPVCRHNNHDPAGFCTISSVIMRLSEKAELQLALQPPCSGNYKTFTF
jgi:predicted choloylglycine hydrolase